MTSDERATIMNLTLLVEKLAGQLQTCVEHTGRLIQNQTALKARVDSLERQCSALHQRTVGLMVVS